MRWGDEEGEAVEQLERVEADRTTSVESGLGELVDELLAALLPGRVELVQTAEWPGDGLAP